MKLDVFMSPSEIAPGDMQGSVVAVIDVLRASTSDRRRARQRRAHRRPGRERRRSDHRSQAVRAKRRCCSPASGKCSPIPGFDLGNSPLEFTSRSGEGLHRTHHHHQRNARAAGLQGARDIVVASYVNHSAVSAMLRAAARSDTDISIVCAGTEGHFSLEDAACAGRYVAPSSSRRSSVTVERRGAARARSSTGSMATTSRKSSRTRPTGKRSPKRDSATTSSPALQWIRTLLSPSTRTDRSPDSDLTASDSGCARGSALRRELVGIALILFALFLAGALAAQGVAMLGGSGDVRSSFGWAGGLLAVSDGADSSAGLPPRCIPLALAAHALRLFGRLDQRTDRSWMVFLLGLVVLLPVASRTGGRRTCAKRRICPDCGEASRRSICCSSPGQRARGSFSLLVAQRADGGDAVVESRARDCRAERPTAQSSSSRRADGSTTNGEGVRQPSNSRAACCSPPSRRRKRCRPSTSG